MDIVERPPDVKTCAHCRRSFARKNPRSQKDWEAQRFCSQRCNLRDRNARLILSDDEVRERLLSGSFVEVNSGCWIWRAKPEAHGYTRIGRSGRKIKAHRVSYELFCGPIPDGMFVCHRCDNRRCINPKHLFLGTHAENTADCVSKGRHAHGERSGVAKLTEADVHAIRACTSPAHAVAERFGVSVTTVRSVRAGKTWAHIKLPEEDQHDR